MAEGKSDKNQLALNRAERELVKRIREGSFPGSCTLKKNAVYEYADGSSMKCRTEFKLEAFKCDDCG
jgi:hypothetical protein